MKQLTRHVREASTPSLGQRRPKSLKLGAAAHGQVGDDGRSPARRRPSKGLSSRWPALRSPASAGDFDQAAPARQTAVMDARGTEHTTFSHCALFRSFASRMTSSARTKARGPKSTPVRPGVNPGSTTDPPPEPAGSRDQHGPSLRPHCGYGGMSRSICTYVLCTRDTGPNYLLRVCTALRQLC